jgi:ActR/RegA family two-component response regulator
LSDTTQYWKVAAAPLGIVITCRGHDRTRSVHRAVADFDALAKAQSGSYAVVADLREMEGYETESRQAWQEAFRKRRAEIRCLVLVGASSPLIRMGAAAVGAFAAIRVRFVSSWTEVEKVLAKSA